MAKEKKAALGYKDMKKALTSGSVEKMYIFTGEEAFLREHCVAQLKKQLVEGVCEQFNHHVFQGGSLDLTALASAIDSYPMMSDRSLITVTDYDIFAQNQENRDRLVDIFNDLPDYCCLVFIYDTISYKADGRYKKLCAAIDANGQVIEFTQQSQSELNSWIRKKFKSLGKEVSASDADYLMFLCGGLMTTLSQEIEKLAAFASDGAVTRAAMDQLVEPTVETVVFDMTNAIADKDFAKALTKLRYLYQKKEEPIGLLSVLASQLRQFYVARLALAQGKNSAYLQKLWGLRSSYAVDLRIKSAKRFSLDWCRKALRLCAETDLKMKSTGYDKELMLEMLILELAEK